jgi:hypothetical protein
VFAGDAAHAIVRSAEWRSRRRLVPTRHHVTDAADIEAIPPPRGPTNLFGVYTVSGYGHLVRCHRLARAFAAPTGFDAYVFGHHPGFRSATRRGPSTRSICPGRWCWTRVP